MLKSIILAYLVATCLISKPHETIEQIANITINQTFGCMWFPTTPMAFWTMAFSYLTTWLYTMCYPQYFDESDDSPYVPKSKRWKTLRATTRLVTWFATNVAARVGETINQWTKYKPGNRKLRRMRKYLGNKINTHSHKWSTRKTALIAMTVIAMRSMTDRQGPSGQHQMRFDTDSGPIGIDNRCSGCISHNIDDFVDGKVTKLNRAIKGFGGTKTMNVSQGTLVWKWTDDTGELHRFEIPNSYYVPDGKVRLLSPQHWAQTQKDNKPIQGTGETTDAKNVTLFWNQRQNKLTVPISKKDNVATFQLASGYTEFHTFCAECEIDTDQEDENPIIASPTFISDDEGSSNNQPTTNVDDHDATRQTGWVQRETPVTFDLNGPKPTTVNYVTDEEERIPETDAAILMRYHHQFGHISFKRLREMAKQGIIPRRLAKVNTPVCSACEYAKATKRQWRSKTSNKEQTIQKPTKPGQVVSVDQLVSPTPGLVAQMTGKLTTKRYKYATVYVDQFTRLGYVYLQKTATAEETLLGKAAFEKYAANKGVEIKAYHADNGIFRANKWVAACEEKKQDLTFAAVNAHHQNGMAEKRIRDLQDLARTMLIHANKRWPNAITANLWPYALRMANANLNATPNFQNKDSISPDQAFSMTNVSINPKHYKPFGCPVYVLDKSLQSNSPFHKWKQRSRVGIYIGPSPQHARNVALVLDRATGLVSPQFHVKFDPSFQSVKGDNQPYTWQMKAGLVSQREKAPQAQRNQQSLPANNTGKVDGTQRPSAGESERHGGNNDHQMGSGEADQQPTATSRSQRAENRRKRKERDDAIARGSPTDQPCRDVPQEVHGEHPGLQLRRDLAARVGKRHKPNGDDQPTGGGPPGTATLTPDNSALNSTVVGRLTRSGNKSTQGPQPHLIEAMLAEMRIATANDVEGEIFCYQALHPETWEHEDEDPLMVYKATADPDTMYMHQAMEQPDKANFIEAMEKEVRDQMDNGNFTIIRRTQVPEGATILPMVWQMRRKRDIKTRQVKKWKARLNIDGSKMKKNIHYDQTYAPVASWNSIRMLLNLTAIHGWHTKQLDYVLAYPQAPIDTELYLDIPKGFEITGGKPGDYVLKLHKNVYGGKASGRIWNQYLVKKLINELGFKQSQVDECVFYKGKTLYVLYTDDSILAGPDEDEIKQIIDDIQNIAKLNITIEGDLEDFLGVNIDRKKDGTIHLTQPHLIDQILKELRLEDDNVSTKTIPAACSKLLSRHSDSEPFDNSFNYRSVIGKLNYLERGSRPDIAYIVHQCARFASNPKVEHGNAIKWLGRYLKGSRDKGTIIKPDLKKDFEVYVDADYAGNWDPKEAATDVDTARSRHGYVIMHAGCPITWKSQLQTEIALSSTESEYTGLSYALRETIPIMELLKEMKANGIKVRSTKPKVHCRVFEDNSGALEIAKVHKFRPRTKHLNNRLHHFRDRVNRGEISIHPISTHHQCGDYLTKPLNEELHVRHRKVVQGW